MADPACALELDRLTVAYGSFVALEDFSARFTGGSCGLLGPNGAGKSSLIRTLLGLLEPLSGKARVLGLEVGAQPIEIRRRVGYMPERDAFLPGMNGVRTLTYLAQLDGLSFREARNRAHEVLYYVGLGEARYRPVSEYSMGMRQRARLAAALVHDPDMVILDEPTNGLDPAGRREMLGLIGDIAARGIHVFLASHLLPDVEHVCEQVLMIDRGRLIGGGRIEELRVSADRIFRARLRGDRARWNQAVRAAQWRVESIDGRHGEGNFEVRVLPAPDQGSADLFALAHGAGLTVLSLVEERRSLEEIFMETLGRGAGDASPGSGEEGEPCRSTI